MTQRQATWRAYVAHGSPTWRSERTVRHPLRASTRDQAPTCNGRYLLLRGWRAATPTSTRLLWSHATDVTRSGND
jgi:hypothetical protein